MDTNGSAADQTKQARNAASMAAALFSPSLDDRSASVITAEDLVMCLEVLRHKIHRQEARVLCVALLHRLPMTLFCSFKCAREILTTMSSIVLSTCTGSKADVVRSGIGLRDPCLLTTFLQQLIEIVHYYVPAQDSRSCQSSDHGSQHSDSALAGSSCNSQSSFESGYL